MDTKSRNFRPYIFWLSTIVLFVSAMVASLATILNTAISRVYDDFYWDTELKFVNKEGFLDEEGFNEAMKGFVINYDHLLVIALVAIGICAVTALLATITTGRKDKDGVVALGRAEFLPVEIICVAAGLLIAGALVLGENILTSFEYGDISPYTEYMSTKAMRYMAHRMMENPNSFSMSGPMMLLHLISIFLCYVGIFAGYLQVVRYFKAHVFWKNTLIGKLSIWCWNYVRACEKTTWKYILIILGLCILSATWIGFIPVALLVIWQVPKYSSKYDKILEGIDEVKSGNLNHKIGLEGDGELERLAGSIDQISDSLDLAVKNELKNQRMKTDLISNVSHDIKTPLTSMISYVDLLKQEGLDSENAHEYLNVIDEKTKRLKKLTDDLFEAAKASSGAMNIDLDNIDMVYIANQALAEMGDKLTERNLDIIFTKKSDKTFVRADGQQLWRVIENLLVNVSKYALAGSRVYIDIYEEDETVKMDIKNMSADRLNISEEELMERFTRGDSSRNTEGSGLGLSIAKDLMNLMGGTFDIKIDGDLFKVTISLAKGDEIKVQEFDYEIGEETVSE